MTLHRADVCRRNNTHDSRLHVIHRPSTFAAVHESGSDPEPTSDAFFRAQVPHGSYLRAGWSDSISGCNVVRGVAAMSERETGGASEAAHSNSDLQEELAEVLRQRAAISAVLRAIANSPHDLQPIFDTILDNAVHLCRAELGSCIWPRKKAFVSLHINRTLQRQ